MTHRFIRQTDLVPLDKISRISASVIGVGAIGRQLAMQLAAIGVPRLKLIDFDKVELHNVTTQGYPISSVGSYKVDQTANDIQEFDPAIAVESIARPWKYTAEDNVIFCAVDSIEVRAEIWNKVKLDVNFWADSRMLGETFRVLTATQTEHQEYYQGTLFAKGEALPGRCTAKSTLYAASLAAGMAIHQFTRWLRGIPTDRDLVVDLLASDLRLG